MRSEGVVVTHTAAKRVLSRWDLATQIIVQRQSVLVCPFVTLAVCDNTCDDTCDNICEKTGDSHVCISVTSSLSARFSGIF